MEAMVFTITGDENQINKPEWWNGVCVVDSECVLYLPARLAAKESEVKDKVDFAGEKFFEYKDVLFVSTDFLTRNYGHVLLTRILVSVAIEYATRNKHVILDALLAMKQFRK